MKKAIIIGGGISGLSTAWLLREKAAAAGLELQVELLEKESQAGGKMRSIHAQGYTCEWGPNGFLDSKPHTLELCRRMGIASSLMRSNDNARKRFIYSGGELHRLPENALSFFRSRLIAWPGKLRLAMEPTPFIKTAPVGTDETLADFGRRRLGREALEKLIAPMVSGVFAGDPETMSLVSCFPRIAELEREYGGLVRAMFCLAGQKRKERAAGKVVSGAAGPGGILTSFPEGIQFLTDALTVQLGEAVKCGKQAVTLKKGQSSAWHVQCADASEYEADYAVVAAPAFSSAELLGGIDTRFSEVLGAIRYSSLTVVCCGYAREAVSNHLDGFGYLIPKGEGRNILGTLWDSSMFDNRAPAGKVLLRSMIGGACFPQYINMDDAELLALVEADLKQVLGITAEPEFVRIFRHPQAIPQYTVGHGARLAALGTLLHDYPGLVLTGNAYRGVGLNDCVAASERAANTVIDKMTGKQNLP